MCRLRLEHLADEGRDMMKRRAVLKEPLGVLQIYDGRYKL